jgi:hypothetical protein
MHSLNHKQTQFHLHFYVSASCSFRYGNIYIFPVCGLFKNAISSLWSRMAVQLLNAETERTRKEGLVTYIKTLYRKYSEKLRHFSIAIFMVPAEVRTHHSPLASEPTCSILRTGDKRKSSNVESKFKFTSEHSTRVTDETALHRQRNLSLDIPQEPPSADIPQYMLIRIAHASSPPRHIYIRRTSPRNEHLTFPFFRKPVTESYLTFIQKNFPSSNTCDVSCKIIDHILE